MPLPAVAQPFAPSSSAMSVIVSGTSLPPFGPIVRATGGLNDTVREGYDGNGFRFHPYTPQHLADAIARCLTCFRDTTGWPILRERGMREDHSWAASAQEYAALYEWAARDKGV